MLPCMSDLSVIKGRQRDTWAAGDYAAVATPLLITSELLCEAADLRGGARVLDVATGSGNTALAAARRKCEVIGLDYVPELLERARERAAPGRVHRARELDAGRFCRPVVPARRASRAAAAGRAFAARMGHRGGPARAAGRRGHA